MKQFKKRILMFLLTSVFTVVSVFAADNYKNSIMGIKFEPGAADSINVILQTKTAYDESINLKRVDANTYVIMLPDVNSLAAIPNPEGYISNVNVKTMPYSSSANGYTKITIKTTSPVNLVGKNTIYVREDNQRRQTGEYNKDVRRERYTDNREYNNRYESGRNNYSRNNYGNREYANRSNRVSNTSTNRTVSNRTNSNRTASNRTSTNTNPNRTAERRTDSKNTVQTDYNKPIENEAISTENQAKKEVQSEPSKSSEPLLIFLGILLIIAASIFFYVKAKNRLTEIAGERIDIDVEEEDDEKQKSGKKKNIKKTIQNLDKTYSNPLKMPVVSEYTQPSPVMSAEKSTDDMNIVDLDELFKEQIKNKDDSADENNALDDFLSDFVFDEPQETEVPDEEFDEDEFNKVINSKNIKFNKDDIECINQILNIEIGDETIKNIDKYAVTRPVQKPKNKVLEELVTSYTVSQNITFTEEDIRTLDKLMNVEIDSDFVHDLRTDPKRTAEMEKQILNFQNSELKKPSEIITLKVSDLLPDLADVAANPEKYADPEPEKFVVDADALLKNIENVSFKPFDDGTRNFEIINNFDEEREENVIELYSPDYKSKKEETMKKASEENTPDAKIKPQTEKKENVKPAQPIERQQAIQKNPENINKKPVPDITNKTEAQQNIQRPSIRERLINRTQSSKQAPKQVLKCIMNGKTYNVVSSVAFSENAGCHLAKGENNYVVLSYIRSKLAVIKEYNDLKSEKIQARLSEKLKDGGQRYIIRIGTVKFLADYINGCISYVMDL